MSSLRSNEYLVGCLISLYILPHILSIIVLLPRCRPEAQSLSQSQDCCPDSNIAASCSFLRSHYSQAKGSHFNFVRFKTLRSPYHDVVVVVVEGSSKLERLIGETVLSSRSNFWTDDDDDPTTNISAEKSSLHLSPPCFNNAK